MIRGFIFKDFAPVTLVIFETNTKMLLGLMGITKAVAAAVGPRG